MATFQRNQYSFSRFLFHHRVPTTHASLRSGLPLKAAVGLACLFCSVAFAQAPVNTDSSQLVPESAIVGTAGVPVEIDGKAVLIIYAQIGGFTAQERAEAIHDRIIALARRRSVPAESIHSEERGTWTEILAGSDRIMGITEADARAAERKRAELAAEYTEVVRQVVKQYREAHTWGHFILGLLYSVAATAALVVLLLFIFMARRRSRSRAERWLARGDDDHFCRSLGGRLWHYLCRPLSAFSRLAFWLAVVAVLQTYLTVVLHFFPSTRQISYQITNWVFTELSTFGRMFIGYVPNLVLVSFICVVTFYLTKVNRYVFEELRAERLTIRGFYPDWAEPTAKLVRVLILAGAAIMVFPYLPGSDSPAFKGISVFLGVLLSLGSTSAVAHAVAGTILTYMRAFQVGDFVRIGNDVGEVIEKTLLVTRICTQKKEVITIPNGTVLGGVVVNYSAEARQRGVIFHTTVTIGYSAPWRQVHELLIAAALATNDVLHDPPPFVLQTALNDFYVAYELNAYTAKPCNMLNAYSALHQNIQDKFNAAGVEINSPHYTSLRDGNRVTIPEQYLPRDYRSPSFELRQVKGSQPVSKESKTPACGDTAKPMYVADR
jgi:small-conductance mechanosensitive channel